MPPEFGDLEAVLVDVPACGDAQILARGERVGLVGRGYAPGALVTIAVTANGGDFQQTLGSVAADDGGALVTVVTIPADVPTKGFAELVARAPTAGGVSLLLSAFLQLGDSLASDGDGDQIPDRCDRCPDLADPNDPDADGDGIGDACDVCPADAENDLDEDGVCADADPCEYDALDDADGDGRCGDADNCPTIANPEQGDADFDGVGDACESLVTPTATPQRTATVTPTPGSTPTPTPGASSLTDPDAAKRAVRCQSAVGKAGATFLKNKQKNFDKCLGAIFRCLQKKEFAKQADCVEKGRVKCDKALAKIFAKHEPKLEADIVKKCGSLDDMRDPEGLGFVGLDDECEALVPPVNLNSVGEIAECIRRLKQCAVERFIRTQFPRAAELLDIAGVDSGLVDRFDCLMGDKTPGDGFGESDPKGAGKAVDKCAKETRKAGAKFVVAKVKSIEKCLNEIFKCVQTKPNDPKCTEKATGKCTKELAPVTGKVAKAEAKLQSSVEKKCGPADEAQLIDSMGMHLDDIESACQQYGVLGIADLSDYSECLFRQHECVVDEIIIAQYPRLEELLGEVGLQDEVPAGFCP